MKGEQKNTGNNASGGKKITKLNKLTRKNKNIRKEGLNK